MGNIIEMHGSAPVWIVDIDETRNKTPAYYIREPFNGRKIVNIHARTWKEAETIRDAAQHRIEQERRQAERDRHRNRNR